MKRDNAEQIVKALAFNMSEGYEDSCDDEACTCLQEKQDAIDTLWALRKRARAYLKRKALLKARQRKGKKS